MASSNPLIQAAASLLLTGPALRALPRHANPALLRDTLIQALRDFESEARNRGVPHEQVLAARYVLCTFIDECAVGAPWGSGTWAARSLLAAFHNEAWGGEQVFVLLDKLTDNVPQHRPLLELIYLVLSLGLEGRYRVLADGAEQRESVRERLAQMLRADRPPVAPELSLRWQGVAPVPARRIDSVPLWTVGTALAVLLCLVFAALRLALADRSDAVFQALQGLPARSAAAAAPPVTATAPPLSDFLAPEIAARQLTVHQLADRAVVTLPGDSLFEPGSAELAARARSLVDRIAEALHAVKGRVIVSGHTDSQPIRTLRFPSNWHVSQQQADAVRTRLARRVEPARLKAEGRADSQPLDDNATAAGRARNRRVEITLSTAPTP